MKVSQFIEVSTAILKEFGLRVTSNVNPLGKIETCTVDFDGGSILGRFTYWETGAIGVEVLNVNTSDLVWSDDTEVHSPTQIKELVQRMQSGTTSEL